VLYEVSIRHALLPSLFRTKVDTSVGCDWYNVVYGEALRVLLERLEKPAKFIVNFCSHMHDINGGSVGVQ